MKEKVKGKMENERGNGENVTDTALLAILGVTGKIRLTQGQGRMGSYAHDN
jgi:hypothetical protein